MIGDRMIKRQRINERKTNKEILDALKTELSRLNTKTKSVYDSERNPGEYCSQTICKYLGMTWREVVSLVCPQPQVKLLSKEEQLKALKGELERIGSYKKRVYAENRNKEKFPNPDLLCKHLDMSWWEIAEACRQMNVVENVNATAGDEELIEEYKTLSEKFGRPLTNEELKKHTKYSIELYSKRFGTISELKLMCGYELRRGDKKPISKEECVQELIRLYKERGKLLTFDEVIEHSNISMTTILRRFHTTKIKEVWNEVLDKKSNYLQ